MKLAFVFIGCLVAAKAAFACSPAENKTLAAFEQEVTVSLKENANASVIDFGYLPSQCKPWPQKGGYAILTKPYLYESSKNSERYFGMVIAVVDEQTGKVLSSVNEKKIMFMGAIEPSEINIDTANYFIEPGRLAFGVRTTRRNYSDAAPIREEMMNMYVIDQNTLTKVINSLLMNSYNGEGDGGCKFSGTENSATLSVLSDKTNGYYNLRERIKMSQIEYAKNGVECKKHVGTVKITDYILQFNGATYEIPQTLKANMN
jgi:hypothetical protein